MDILSDTPLKVASILDDTSVLVMVFVTVLNIDASLVVDSDNIIELIVLLAEANLLESDSVNTVVFNTLLVNASILDTESDGIINSVNALVDTLNLANVSDNTIEFVTSLNCWVILFDTSVKDIVFNTLRNEPYALVTESLNVIVLSTVLNDAKIRVDTSDDVIELITLLADDSILVGVSVSMVVLSTVRCNAINLDATSLMVMVLATLLIAPKILAIESVIEIDSIMLLADANNRDTVSPDVIVFNTVRNILVDLDVTSLNVIVLVTTLLPPNTLDNTSVIGLLRNVSNTIPSNTVPSNNEWFSNIVLNEVSFLVTASLSTVVFNTVLSRLIARDIESDIDTLCETERLPDRVLDIESDISFVLLIVSNTRGSNNVLSNSLPLSNKYLTADGVIAVIIWFNVIVLSTVLRELYILPAESLREIVLLVERSEFNILDITSLGDIESLVARFACIEYSAESVNVITPPLSVSNTALSNTFISNNRGVSATFLVRWLCVSKTTSSYTIGSNRRVNKLIIHYNFIKNNGCSKN